jgi:hypothetical protein
MNTLLPKTVPIKSVNNKQKQVSYSCRRPFVGRIKPVACVISYTILFASILGASKHSYIKTTSSNFLNEQNTMVKGAADAAEGSSNELLLSGAMPLASSVISVSKQQRR